MSELSAVNSSELTAPQSTIRQLADQHSNLESQLRQLHDKKFLTADEEVELVRIKKRKLQLKDEMQALQRSVPVRRAAS